ncbi:hypothetical protein [Novilysobacter antarcticus]|uniref:hypothetical protein n=1 Tax=Novilysobacter antarcticus TaxID=2862543 RepID=UPI001C99BF69|nr:hypothetical protein [Lysobacter antarcticus]
MPVMDEAAHPDLIATPQGDLMLSWVEPSPEGERQLRIARFDVLLSWLQQDERGTGQRLMLSRTDRQLQVVRSIPVVELAARGRASGIPRLAVRNGAAWLVWVEVREGTPSLKGAVVR